MKNKFFASVLLIFLAVSVFGQTVHNPNSELYRDIDLWVVQGYIRTFLPMIRPYPTQLILRILDEVIENGSADAQQRAARYRDMLAPGSRVFNPGVLSHVQGGNREPEQVLGQHEVREGGSGNRNFILAPFVEGNFFINNLLSASYNFTAYGITDTSGERFNVPGTYSPFPDFITDIADIGSFAMRQSWTALTAFGTSDTYLQAGLSRSSVGPFFDNGAVVGPQAPRHGHIGFVFWRPQWSFEMLLQVITATDDFGIIRSNADLFPDKFNIIHYLSFRPIQNLEFGLVQAQVFGGRMELMYLVPFSFLFHTQSIFGFEDNAFLGFHMRWRPFNTLLLKGQVYIDDFHFNNFLAGSIQAKAAGQAGVSWAPRRSFLSRLDFDYTMILPYTFSHWCHHPRDRWNGAYTGDGRPYLGNAMNPGAYNRRPNLKNYTHMGRNIGPDLQPNSDRLSLRTRWNITPGININLSAYLIRHGNASYGQDRLDREYRDGSIFDCGTRDHWLNGNVRNDRIILGFSDFLTQPVIETRLGGGIGVTWTIPTAFGTFALIGEYGAEQGWNRSMRTGDPRLSDGINWAQGGPQRGNNSLYHFWSIGGRWSW